MTVVRAYVGVTDNDWYRFLAARPEVTEVNFWQPSSGREFRVLAPGEPFFFKTHSPHNKVVGGGFFRDSARLRVSEAWEQFGEANGVESIEQMRARIGRYRRTPMDSSEDPLIGCLLLQDVRFFPQDAIADPPPHFAANIVQGKSYDTAEPSVAPYFEMLLKQLAPQIFDKPSSSEDASRTIEPARLIVPAITDDAIEGHPDRLGVDEDARALAALVASRQLEPPLAIGLYGEWGSGKTFFMKRVQSYIEKLGESAAEVFYSGVAPIWFSAWQYAEGNLWASLLHHIFASLYPDKPQPQLALDEVMEKVESAQQVTLAVAEQVEAATIRRDSAVEAITAAEERHRKALEDSRKLRTKDLWDAITLTANDQDLKTQVVSAADELGLTVASDSAQDVMRATQQVVELASRARVLATSGPWYRSPLVC
jgi:KAP family P-loop domain